jgi:Anti-sigma-K factor rskA
MTTLPPDFDELVDQEELTRAERERLRLAHDLLVRAGPPPELPQELARPPQMRAKVSFLPRRRRVALALVAAALIAAAFGGGYLVGNQGGEPAGKGNFSVAMRGTQRAPNAVASLIVFDKDASDNWPMLMKVRGLKKLPDGGYYELYLTRHGKIGPECGTFRVHGGTTSVRLNAPYQLKRFDGWVVTQNRQGTGSAGPVVMTT